MGFFASGNGRQSKEMSVSLLHRLQCRACPLDKIKTNAHPHMAPTGSDKPLVYMLGEAPGEREDEEGIQFIGKSGKILRVRVPDDPYRIPVRWNNVVRTRPPGNATPERTEIECCRPSVEADIAETKPKAIFGFGNIPLKWAINQTGIEKWRGRRIPVNIGGHVCWFYPFMHPSFLLRIRRGEDMRPQDIGSEQERAFVFDLERAFEEIESLPDPQVWTRHDVENAIEIVECSASGLEKLRQLFHWTEQQVGVGVDYETQGKRPYGTDSRILSAGIGTAQLSFAFGMDHPGAAWTKSQRKEVDKLWVKFLRSSVKKRVHNLAFEHEWTAVFYGADLLRASHWDCSYVQATVLDERIGDRKPGCLGLEFLVQQHFGINIKELSPVNRKNLEREPLEDVLRYNAPDAKFHQLLFEVQDELIENYNFRKVYKKRLRRVPTLVLTQIKGVPIDLEENRRLEKKYAALVDAAEKEIAKLPEVAQYKAQFGQTFSSASNKDLGNMLLKVMKRREGLTDEGKYVVDEDVLAKIKHPLCTWELKRRKAQKRLSTYILPYGESSEFFWPDGLIHPTINPFGTVSDRTSAEDPNVQNMPKHDKEAKEVRKQVRAPKGQLVVSVDYGQIQFRGIGVMSRDKRLVKYIWDRHDVHGEWAERIAYEYPERIGGKQMLKDKPAMKTFRQDVKNKWTFPLCFGSQLAGVADNLQIPMEYLQPLERQWWNEFSGIKDWHEVLRQTYQKHGYVKHLSGGINRAPLSYNQMINYPIQALEAEIVLDAMCRLSEREDPLYQPILEIHDDLTFLLPEKRLDDCVEEIVDDMLGYLDEYEWLNVPLSVEVSVGENLKEMEEVLVVFSDDWKKAA